MPDQRPDPHVVVLGGGMSGLCAALAAAGAGVRVTVVEAGREPGGSMRLSGGLVWGPRDLETARRCIPKGDAALQEVLVRELPHGWAWLESLGLPLTAESDCLKDDMGRGRMMDLGAGGARGPFADRMAVVLAESGGRLLVQTRVTALEAAASGWTLEVESPDGTERLEATAVVTATGGFQNSREWLRRYVTTTPERLVLRSNRHSDGTGLALLTAQGAAVSNGMSSFYGHSMPLLDRPLEPAEYIPASQYYSDYALALNLLGLRFTDESIGVLDEHNAQVGSRQPESRYYLVFDEGVRRRHVLSDAGLPGVLGSVVADRLALVRDLGGTVLQSDTLEGLAGLLEVEGLPAANVLDTVAQYNRAADPVRGLFPTRQSHHEPLVEPPFYAVSCVAGITYTMGGLRVSPRCEVLDDAGSPIPRAFAAGADAGGVFQDVYGGGLGWALVSGRRAGTAAAGAA